MILGIHVTAATSAACIEYATRHNAAALSVLDRSAPFYVAAYFVAQTGGASSKTAPCSRLSPSLYGNRPGQPMLTPLFSEKAWKFYKSGCSLRLAIKSVNKLQLGDEFVSQSSVAIAN